MVSEEEETHMVSEVLFPHASLHSDPWKEKEISNSIWCLTCCTPVCPQKKSYGVSAQGLGGGEIWCCQTGAIVNNIIKKIQFDIKNDNV